jgi:hypothetical protein
MRQDELMLSFAEITAIINRANADLEEFCLQNKITRGRDLRRQLREMREACTTTLKKSLQYEKDLRQTKRKKK